VKSCLRANGYVITRRFSNTEDQIPIGICGKERHQRFATSIPRRLVRRIVTPPELLRLVDHLSNKCFPALLSLKLLKQRWLDLKLPWGPIGSVSRELLIGASIVSADSDLDIVIRAEKRFTKDDAQSLAASTLDLPARVDIRVETPFCGFALAEFGWRGPGEILLRTAIGPILGSDPWAEPRRCYPK
jgi:phosphoribosyl-dephospho-CoA transferase